MARGLIRRLKKTNTNIKCYLIAFQEVLRKLRPDVSLHSHLCTCDNIANTTYFRAVFVGLFINIYFVPTLQPSFHQLIPSPVFPRLITLVLIVFPSLPPQLFLLKMFLKCFLKINDVLRASATRLNAILFTSPCISRSADCFVELCCTRDGKVDRHPRSDSK